MKLVIFFLSTVLICTSINANTIMWRANGVTIGTTTCNNGDDVTPPSAPEKQGYTFKEWRAAEYEILEYIQGTTNVQYINTGIVPTSDMSITAKFVNVSNSNTNSNSSFFGARNSANTSGVYSWLAPSQLRFQWFAGTRHEIANTRENEDIYEYNIKNSVVTIKKNGVEFTTATFSPNASNSTTATLYINAVNNGGIVDRGNNTSVNRIYPFIIDGVAEMLPARRLSDEAIGMYDTLRNQFFTNAGTGEFTAGPVTGAQ